MVLLHLDFQLQQAVFRRHHVRGRIAARPRAALRLGDDVAELLFVHPQTVRYRMTQIRELYGERLSDPAVVLNLVLALG